MNGFFRGVAHVKFLPVSVQVVVCGQLSATLILASVYEPEFPETSNEPPHQIMALFVLRKLILQMRLRSHPMGLDV